MYNFPMPVGGGNSQTDQMLHMAMMANNDPATLAKLMAASGVAPPALPPAIPVQSSPLADITPVKPNTAPGIGGFTPPTPQLKEIPMTPPTVDPTTLAGGPPLGPANMAPGFNIGGLMQALGALQVPQTQQFPQRVDFAPAMPLNRTGTQLNPQITQLMMQMMGGAQGVRPQPGMPSLGGMIAGR